MEWSSYNSVSFSWLCICAFATAIFFLIFRRETQSRKGRLPPGPRGWPIVGNMFVLGTTPLQRLQMLRHQYGPVLWLKLGTVNTMVIQSATAAQELYKNHDLAFADRKVPHAITASGFHKGNVAFSNYCHYWKMLRRFYTSELFVNRRIIELAPLRRKCIDNMISWVEEKSFESRAEGGSGEVQLDLIIFLMTFNLTGNMIFSKDLVDLKSEKGLEFFDAMSKFMKVTGKSNIVDYFPLLRRFDPQGIGREMKSATNRCVEIISGFVKERVEEKRKGVGNGRKDFLDVLLEFEDNHDENETKHQKLSDDVVNAIILEMIFTGTETTSSTIEWVMAELLRNPNSMRKAKEELLETVGKNSKVEETDMNKLPYLQAVIKETFRLHPAGPLLLPKNTREDTNYMGYYIPKGTQVLINVWCIGRDREIWDNPLVFMPERFIGSNIDYKGQHYGLLPFGSGRRACVGIPLAQRVVNLSVATLLQSFDWELHGFNDPKELDMSERMGIALKKLVPLKAIPKKTSYF